MSTIRVYLTCPDRETALDIAAALLDERLIACANIGGEVTSLYVWEGVRNTESEVPMVLKSRADYWARLEARICALHPYEVPSLAAVRVDHSHAPFDAWVADATSGGG